jgi:hypothetical protein
LRRGAAAWENLVDQSVLVLVPELYRAKNFLSGKSPVDPTASSF